MKTPNDLIEVGSSITRFDGYSKVTGENRYTADLNFPGMIWGRCLRSPLAHARILRIDVSRAKKLKGVTAVLTAADIPDRLVGRRLKDMPVLARDRVRFIGERIAVVGAETPEIAEDALACIEVEYEELKAVYSPLDAMASDAPILHEDLMSYENLWLPLPDLPNVHSHMQMKLGECEKGFAESDFIFEQTFTTQRVHHGYLEPHVVIVRVDESGRFLVSSPSKGPYATREQLAEWMGIEQAKIAFQLNPIGGDFGGKGSLMDIPLCCYLAQSTGRPVKMLMSYSEELTAATPRHPSTVTIKTGVKKDGRLWARKVEALFNSGAYAAIKNNVNINLPGARSGAGAYKIPHVSIDALSVYTNCVPSGIMRAPGEAQMIFAVESHMDHMARELGIDPYEFRLRNVLDRESSLSGGLRLTNDKGKELLEKVRAQFKWNHAGPKKRYVGRGLALCVRQVGPGESNVEIGIKDDGRVYILTTIPDTGTGSHTIFRQIVGDALGTGAKNIDVVLGTTDSFVTDHMIGGSRVTYLAGQAVLSAALRLRDRLSDVAAERFHCPAASIRVSQGIVSGPNQNKISFSTLAVEAAAVGMPLRQSGNFAASERAEDVSFFAQAVEVEVDPETGRVRVLKILSAHDVGTIINPLSHQGQIDGGVIQGLGFALLENLSEEEGKITATNLGEYKMPSAADIPDHRTVFVHDRKGPGPFQSKPIGENGILPTAPAIANAVYDAIGVQITELPITAEKIYFAMREKSEA
jgi:CO/xanthine dehydrogenase Mo-binding subunit